MTPPDINSEFYNLRAFDYLRIEMLCMAVKHPFQSIYPVLVFIYRNLLDPLLRDLSREDFCFSVDIVTSLLSGTAITSLARKWFR